MRKFNHSMTILLDDRTFDALAASAELTDLSKGSIVRYAVTYYTQMVVHATPMCANGQQCFCPNMHQRIASPANLMPAPPPPAPTPQPNETPSTPEHQVKTIDKVRP